MPRACPPQEAEFLEYFHCIDRSAIKEILSQYRSTGPAGYATSSVLARILKVKERISSDRELSDKLNKIAMELFPRCGFEGGYGLTETGPYGCRLLPDDHRTEGFEKDLARLGSVGRMAINGMLKIVDRNGRSLPPGQIGEIAIFCDSNMVGYWNKPEETAMTLVDGWVMTGDLGEMDEEGYVYIRDRSKDLIISGGFNIFPREIEDVLNSHPAIRESAVIGVPDEKWGEAVTACVILKDGHALSEADCIEYCRHELADFKKPRRVVVVKDFPRSPIGKVQKYKLREDYGTLGR